MRIWPGRRAPLRNFISREELKLSRRLARARLAQALGTVCRVVGSATQCCRTALLGSAWYCRLGLGSAWALAAFGPWQRWAALRHGLRWAALGSACLRWAALGSAGQRYWYWQRLAALGIYRQRLVLALLSAGQRLGFGSAGQRCGMGSARQRWAALPSATSTGSAAQRCPALGSAGQRWAALPVLVALPSAAERCPALPSSGQRWAAVCRYSRCPAVKKPLISAALKSL